jgi:hypothetical protein
MAPWARAKRRPRAVTRGTELQQRRRARAPSNAKVETLAPLAVCRSRGWGAADYESRPPQRDSYSVVVARRK